MTSFFDSESPPTAESFGVGTVRLDQAHDSSRLRMSGRARFPAIAVLHFRPCVFCLKDDRARIDASSGGHLARLKFPAGEGDGGHPTGRVTTFPGSSKYQIVIDSLEPGCRCADGADRGNASVSLPRKGFSMRAASGRAFHARVIGVVTSPTGAVIRDILHRIADRFPGPCHRLRCRARATAPARRLWQANRRFQCAAAGRRILAPTC